jgi:hypothetical protein
MADPKKAVEAFLRSPEAARHQGGGVCATCQLSNRQQIDYALRYFAQCREDGRTTVPWRTFAEHVIVRGDFDYPYKWRAVLKHAGDCLGIETKQG